MLAGDSFGGFNALYYLLNELAQNHSFPRWMPFHGFGTSVHFLAGFGFSLLFPFQALGVLFFPSINIGFLSHIGFLFNEVILLAGVYACSKHFYRHSLSVAFVGISLVGSVLCLHNNTAGLNSFYLVPWMIYFQWVGVHRHNFSAVLFSFTLLLGATLGNTPYYLPVQLMFWFLNFIFVFFNLEPGERSNWLQKSFKNDSKKERIGVALLATLLVGYFYFNTMDGAQKVAFAVSLRSPDGSIPLYDFVHLNFSGHTPLLKYLEWFIGINFNSNLSIYFGFFGIFFSLLGIYASFIKPTDPKRRHGKFLTALTLINIAFACGTIVTALTYYVIPLMQYFKYLGTSNGFLRIWMIFLAGYGMEYFLHSNRSTRKILIFMLLGILFCLGLISYDYQAQSGFFADLWFSKGLGNLTALEHSSIIRTMEGFWLLYLGVAFFSVLLLLKFRSRIGILPIAVVLVLFQIIGVAAYRYHFTKTHNASGLSPGAWDIYQLGPYSYPPQRTFDYLGNAKFRKLTLHTGYFFSSDRAKSYYDLHGKSGSERYEYRFPVPDVGMVEVIQEDLDNVLFFDNCYTYFPARFHKPLGLLLREYFGHLMRPSDHFILPKTLREVLGCETDKIQFFSSANYLSQEQSKRALLDFKKVGFLNLPRPILTLNPDETSPATSSSSLIEKIRLNDVAYEIKHFSSNRLLLEIQRPPVINKSGHLILYYADAWDPNWLASQDGRPARVYQADMGFKAVQVDFGPNTKSTQVEFAYRDYRLDAMYLFSILGGLGILGVLLIQIKRLFNSPLKQNPKSKFRKKYPS